MTTTTTTREPTKQQAKLIKLASRENGCTRADVRTALKYAAGANIPVQIMLLKLQRFGYTLRTERAEDGHRVATYFLDPLTAKPARKANGAAKPAAKKTAAKKPAAKPAPRKRGKPKASK